MTPSQSAGLGTKLRRLLTLLDGELATFYAKRESEFRPRFYPVFQLLLVRGAATVSDIAEHIRVSQPAATQTLKEMVRFGFVGLGRGENHRERIVSLSPHGRATAATLLPIWEAVGGAAADLDAELSQPLGAILDEAIVALERSSFSERIEHQLTLQGA